MLSGRTDQHGSGLGSLSGGAPMRCAGLQQQEPGRAGEVLKHVRCSPYANAYLLFRRRCLFVPRLPSGTTHGAPGPGRSSIVGRRHLAVTCGQGRPARAWSSCCIRTASPHRPRLRNGLCSASQTRACFSIWRLHQSILLSFF